MPSDTRTQLMAEAEILVRRQGYAGFSYAQLAEAVGIRKPSIHHHFPSKEDLGAAIVAACCEEFGRRLEAAVARSADFWERLDDYAGLYRDTLRNGQGCLCGVLASEIDILPERVRTGVRRFLQLNLDWLARVLGEAQARGAIAAGLDVPSQSRLVLATMQGALLTARGLGDGTAFEMALEALKRNLQPGEIAAPCH